MQLPKSALAAGAAIIALTGVAAAQEVNIYSYRQPELIKPLLDAFTAETGVKTNVLFLDKGLEERIEAEGLNSPADVILSVDIGRLAAAKEKGITQALDDSVVEQNIPAQYRDSEDHWFEGSGEAGCDHL